jgi:cysteine protease ATG4
MRKEAKQIVRKIMWFSYRKNIHIKNEKNDYKSDVGWGCLARVGQMALASALNKYF